MNKQTVMLCTIYRCSKEREMYIYVDRSEGLKRVPEELLQRTGVLSEVMTLKLDQERKLARVKAADVLLAIANNGFFLQLPPDIQVGQFTMGE